MNSLKTLFRSLTAGLLVAAVALAAACKSGEKSGDGSGSSADPASTAASTTPASTPADPTTPPAAAPGQAGEQAVPAPAPPGGVSPPTAPPGGPPVPPPPIAPSGPPAQVVAKVNGKEITRRELDFAVNGMAQGRIPPNRHAEFRRDVLNSLIDQELVYQKAVASKVDVTPAEISASIAKVRQNFPTQKAFEDELAKDGMTMASVESMFRHNMIIDKYIKNNVVENVKVTREDEAKFYQENLDKMKHPEQVRASHILLRAEKSAPADQKTAQKKKAEEALTKARSGSDFASLAKEYSQDPGSAERGGDLGYFERGKMVPAFDKAAFSLKAGAISDIVETDFGYHIIKVTDHRAAGLTPIDDVRQRINEYLANEKVKGEVQKLTADLRKQARIEMSL